jgi:adenosylmethionine-8-amino-7-oxononanoate aminotransferase
MTARLLSSTVDDIRAQYGRIDGCIVTLADGRQMIDTVGGGHVCAISHQVYILAELMAESVRRHAAPMSGRYFQFESAAQLAERIVNLWGDPEAKVYFTAGGTEAFEVALQLCLHVQRIRNKPDRTAVVGRSSSYHGMSLAAVSAGGHVKHRARLAPFMYDWPKFHEPRCDACPLGLTRPSCAFACSVTPEMLRRSAAVIFEPVGGTTAGATVPPEGYYADLYGRIHVAQSIAISDEVVTGFGRTGKSFVSSPETSDVVIAGKLLAGGFAPICAVIVSGKLAGEILAAKVEIPLRLTHANNALTCAIGLSVQEYVAQHKLVERAADSGLRLGAYLKDACERSSSGFRPRGVGLLWSIERACPDPNGTLRKIFANAAAHGVVVMGGSQIRSERAMGRVHLMCTPALDATDNDLHQIVDALMEVVDCV